jgi:hypothetical protein
VLLFPNFQRSFGFTSHPFFKRECKGKGLYVSTKFIFDFIRIIWRENQLFCEELSRFLKAGCKDTEWQVTSKVLLQVLFTFATQSIHKFRELIALLSKRGAKIRSGNFLPNLF